MKIPFFEKSFIVIFILISCTCYSQQSRRDFIKILNHANQKQRNGHFSEAIALYREIIEKNSSIKYNAALYAARAYRKMGQIESASRLWNYIIRSNAPENLKSKARFLLERKYYMQRAAPDFSAPDAKPEKRFALYIDILGNYNKNPYSDSVDELENLEEDTSDLEGKIEIEASYKFLKNKNFEAELIASYLGSHFNKERDANTNIFIAELPFSYFQSKSRYQLMPAYEIEQEGSETVLKTASLLAEYSYKWNLHQFSLGFEYLMHEAAIEENESLEGSALKGLISYSYLLPQGQLFTALDYTQNNLNDTLTEITSHNQYQFSISYSHYFKNLTLSLLASLQNSLYETDEILNQQREDFFWSLQLKLKYHWSRNLAFYALVNYAQNNSNFDGKTTTEDHRFENQNLGLGLTYTL